MHSVLGRASPTVIYMCKHAVHACCCCVKSREVLPCCTFIALDSKQRGKSVINSGNVHNPQGHSTLCKEPLYRASL